jgi:hypothetical protein
MAKTRSDTDYTKHPPTELTAYYTGNNGSKPNNTKNGLYLVLADLVELIANSTYGNQ